MYKTIRVGVGERVVVLRDGVPERALGPGKYGLWGFGIETLPIQTSELVFTLAPEIREVLPEGWSDQVKLGSRQRALVYVDGKPVRYLGPGTHRFWTFDPSVRVEVMNVDDPVPELTEDALRLIPAKDLLQVVIGEHERGLLYVQGRFERVLDPGRHVMWSHPEARATVTRVDMRVKQLTLGGQELMTKDKVTLRLSLTVEWARKDPTTAIHQVTDPEAAVYLAVQLAARDYVAGVTLDELLEGRDDFTRFLESRTKPEADRVGLRVDRVGVKDVVLPGDMKVLLNRVIEAEKQAAANVILRREEAASTRAMANAARVMAEEPTLLRLKELETLEKVAARIGELKLFVGSEGLRSLLPKSEVIDGD